MHGDVAGHTVSAADEAIGTGSVSKTHTPGHEALSGLTGARDERVRAEFGMHAKQWPHVHAGAHVVAPTLRIATGAAEGAQRAAADPDGAAQSADRDRRAHGRTRAPEPQMRRAVRAHAARRKGATRATRGGNGEFERRAVTESEQAPIESPPIVIGEIGLGCTLGGHHARGCDGLRRR
jgi:hypothetical protein